MNIVQTAGKLGMLYLNRVIILIVQSIKIQIFNQDIFKINSATSRWR